MDDVFWDDMIKRFSRGVFMACAALIMVWSQSYFEYQAWNIALLMLVFSMIRGMSKCGIAGLAFLFLLVIIPPKLFYGTLAFISGVSAG